MDTEAKLNKAVEALYKSLTTIWEDNGNIMAGAIRDIVMLEISQITGVSFEEVDQKVEQMVEEMQ